VPVGVSVSVAESIVLRVKGLDAFESSLSM